MNWSRRRRNGTRVFFEFFEGGVKEGGCCDVFRTFCSTWLRSGQGLRNPFFLALLFFFFRF